MSKYNQRIITGILLAGCCSLFAQSAGDALQQGFQNPPDSAKPRVWWHWMNGNVTEEGIRLDLEWMKRSGIGGFQNFDAALDTPQVVEKRLVYMTPEWRSAFRYAAKLADQLGLEMAVASSPGWSETGGPWVKPEQAMKKYVWAETRVEGGKPFHGVLAKPSETTGYFQNIGTARGAAEPHFYADAAVVAFRTPDTDISLTELHPKITSSGGKFEAGPLSDGDLSKKIPLPWAPLNEKAWIQFEFEQPHTFRGFTLAIIGGAAPFVKPTVPPVLEASDDGTQFRAVGEFPLTSPGSHTITFAPVTARFLRVSIKTATARTTPANYPIAQMVPHLDGRVDHLAEKAAFSTFADLYSVPTAPVDEPCVVAKESVIDLTSKMHADGTLDWTPPPGRWVVTRLGYSLRGNTNRAASPEATGLEVDKLSRKHMKSYLDTYLGQYQDTLGELMGKRGLQYLVTDSWEAGTLNWTDDMLAEFTKRRGYDPHPWLPVLTGRVVDSAAASDRFLWDFRKTIGELITEYHYEQIGEWAHTRGMGLYSESHEGGRAFPGDGMDVKKKSDVPMGAMWLAKAGAKAPWHDADIRESASVAHLYGQNLVAAESLTAASGPAWAPENLKPTADRELAMGLNRFVIHTSVHQPLSDKVPGLSLGEYGQWFTRNETWAEISKPWMTYLARSSYMLQQGKFAADIAYFYGEDSNITALFSNRQPEIPAGYSFDYVSADALLNRLSASHGLITTSTGMRYRMLVLDPNSQHMTMPVLKKIRDLVTAGAVVVGPKPVESPSLTDDQREFRALVNLLWGTGRVKNRTVAEALSAARVTPDFEYSKPQSDTELMFVHRRIADGEIYWVDNRQHREENVEVSFRVFGKAPELWYPESGQTAPAAYKVVAERITVPLHLDPDEAVFVVFRKAGRRPREISRLMETPLSTVEGAWDVNFPAGRGAPERIQLDKLGSWSEQPDAGVKYFSGTASYVKTIEAQGGWFTAGNRLWLDLGEVKNLAEVSVNGKSLGVVWKAPFRVDVTDALKPGANRLEIKVTNLWVNRLIGDEQPGVTKRYTYTSQKFYRADSPLMPSGLLGPVRVVGISAGR